MVGYRRVWPLFRSMAAVAAFAGSLGPMEAPRLLPEPPRIEQYVPRPRLHDKRDPKRKKPVRGYAGLFRERHTRRNKGYMFAASAELRVPGVGDDRDDRYLHAAARARRRATT